MILNLYVKKLEYIKCNTALLNQIDLETKCLEKGKNLGNLF